MERALRIWKAVRETLYEYRSWWAVPMVVGLALVAILILATLGREESAFRYLNF